MSSSAMLDQLLSGPLLLDFDGPICSIFARYPAPVIARELLDLLNSEGIRLPTDIHHNDDPLEVLRWVGSKGVPSTIRAVEDALCRAEMKAAETAEPTRYAREVIISAREAGLPVAIVSNNSAGAIRTYLEQHRLDRHISWITGRTYADPSMMKPNPAPILSTAQHLRATPGRCVMVGDSVSDIAGALAAGMPAIGYANKDWKSSAFSQAGANAIVRSMSELANVLISAD